MISIPSQQTKQVSQNNNGDILGVLYATRNINLDKAGYISLAKRTKFVRQAATNASSPDNFGLVYDIVYNPILSAYTIFTQNGIYQSANASNVTTWTQHFNGSGTGKTNTGADTPFDTFGGIYWNSALYSINPTTIKKMTASTWSASIAAVAPTTTTLHPYAINEKKNTLCYGDGNVLRSITSADAAGTTLTLPTKYRISTVTFSNDKMFIGTIDTSGGNGKMFVWDGTSTEANAAYDQNAQAVISACKYESGVMVLNSIGELRVSNGGGLTRVAAFPIYYEPEYWYTAFANWSFAAVPKAMTSSGDTAYINVSDNIVGGSRKAIPYQYSGVWCYDPQGGLYHRYAGSVYQDTTDYGQSQNFNTAGAIVYLIEPTLVAGGVPTEANGGEILFGSDTIREGSGAGNRYYSLCSVTSGVNKGSIVSNKIMSNGVRDTYQKIYVKYRNLIDATDKIIVSYRTSEVSNLPFITNNGYNAGITWTSSTVFTSTATQFANVVVGHEVEIVAGVGSGNTSLITAISENAGTYTVTIADAVGGASTNTGNVLVNNWTGHTTITSSSSADGFYEIPVGKTSKWIQVKAELQGDDVQIEEIQVVQVNQQPSK